MVYCNVSLGYFLQPIVFIPLFSRYFLFNINLWIPKIVIFIIVLINISTSKNVVENIIKICAWNYLQSQIPLTPNTFQRYFLIEVHFRYIKDEIYTEMILLFSINVSDNKYFVYFWIFCQLQSYIKTIKWLNYLFNDRRTFRPMVIFKLKYIYIWSCHV